MTVEAAVRNAIRLGLLEWGYTPADLAIESLSSDLAGYVMRALRGSAVLRQQKVTTPLR